MASSNIIVTASQTLGPRVTIGIAVFTGYIALCRGLRFLRRNRKHAKYPYKNREDFAKMTGEHAWEIIEDISTFEFPIMHKMALSFALFKTYGIPTVSKLLCETQQLATVEHVARRYADTSVLIGGFLGFSPSSEPANAAIARMNYLHGRYQKAGKISNDDMLYTMSLFILQVEKWIRLYEWRDLTSMEICALGTHWKSVGNAMNIQFDDLAHGPDNFRDGLEFFEDVSLWAEAYEQRCMVPSDWNHQLAEETSNILMADLPDFLKGPGKQLQFTLMEKRLRRAMIYPDPSPFYMCISAFTIGTRRFFLKYLSLPRPSFLKYLTLTHPDPKTGRMYRLEYAGEPWYVQPTFLERNSALSWFRWALGLPYPNGDEKYKPDGYATFEIGPKKLEGKGLDECEATLDKLMKANRGGCPFAFQ